MFNFSRFHEAICKSWNGESGSGMKEIMGMRGITVGMMEIRVIRVDLQRFTFTKKVLSHFGQKISFREFKVLTFKIACFFRNNKYFSR